MFIQMFLKEPREKIVSWHLKMPMAHQNAYSLSFC